MLDAIPAAHPPARPAAAAAAVPPPDDPSTLIPDRASALISAAATFLLPVLESGRPLDAATLRSAMTRAHRASDAEGAWLWKDAYEAAEAAVRHVRPPLRRAPSANAPAPGADGPRKMLDFFAAQSPRSSPPTPGDPKRRSASSNSRHRSHSRMPRSRPPPSARATSCWSPPPAPACSQ